MSTNTELPTIYNMAHVHSRYGGDTLGTSTVGGFVPISTTAGVPTWEYPKEYTRSRLRDMDYDNIERYVSSLQLPSNDDDEEEDKCMSDSNKRIVQVFIADPDENVPVDKSLLYIGEQKVTDLTDQELFFEIDLKALLDAHNRIRVEMVNKSVKERTEYLEPARIRDLVMTVVTVASF